VGRGADPNRRQPRTPRGSSIVALALVLSELFRERAAIDTPLALDLLSLAARAPAVGLGALTFRLVRGRVRSEEVRAFLEVLVADQVVTRQNSFLSAGPRLGELTTYASPTPALRRRVRSLSPLQVDPRPRSVWPCSRTSRTICSRGTVGSVLPTT
jgi:hypothetical protein